MGMKPEAVLHILIQADTRRAQAQLRKVQEQLDQMSVRSRPVKVINTRRERLRAWGCLVLVLIAIGLVVVAMIWVDSLLLGSSNY